MQSLPANIKKSVAALLLGLLVFILAEKNVHVHERTSNVLQHDGLPVATTGFSCLICEYQLTGDADEPDVFTVSIAENFSNSFTSSFKQQYCAHSIPGTGERGPPVYC